MEKLTARQSEVLQLIKDHIGETGYPPTRAEIAKQLGFKSPNAAEEHLKALARKGSIEIIAGASRGIRLPENLGLPIIGRVAAGSPILAEAHIEDYCDMPGSIFSPSADYFLRVKGDSMINAGIFDDDLLAVHRTNTVRNGQIVVARIDNEVTVKRFKQQKSKFHLSLLAENPDYPPIDVDLREQDFAIEGLSVGILRRGS